MDTAKITIQFKPASVFGIPEFTKYIGHTPTSLEIAKLIINHCQSTKQDKCIALRHSKWCFAQVNPDKFYQFSNAEVDKFRTMIFPIYQESRTPQLSLFSNN